MTESFLAGNGALWVQPDGAGTELYYLGCHEISSLTYSLGDASLVFCPSPIEPNAFQPIQLYRNEPSAATASAETYILSVIDWLEALDGVFNMYVVEVLSGRKNDFDNYNRVWVLHDAVITTIDRSNLTIQSPGDQAPTSQEFEIVATDLYTLTKAGSLKQVTLELGNACVGLDLIGPEKTYASGVNKLRVYKNVFTGDEDGEVRISHDAGRTWTYGAFPFGANKVSSLATVQLNPTNYRIIAARGEFGANNFALSESIAAGWWDSINVGVFGAYGSPYTGEALFAASPEIIWFTSATNGLFKSVDSGESFTLVGDYGNSDSIKFLSQNVGFFSGADNKIHRTLDGGTTWVSFDGSDDETGNQIMTIEPITKEKVWIAYFNGNVYSCSSITEGNWEFAHLSVIPRAVYSISFFNDLLGFMSCDISVSKPLVYRTVNGGRTWETIKPLEGTYSCRNIKMVAPNLAYVATRVD